MLIVCPDDSFWIAEPFTIKGMEIHHHQSDCLPKRLICCLQGQSHNEGLCNQIWFYHIYWTADLSAAKFNWMVHYYRLQRFVKKIQLFSRSRSQSRFKTFLILYVPYIFCTIDLLATKLGVLIYYFLSPNQVRQSGHLLTVALSLSASLDT